MTKRVPILIKDTNTRVFPNVSEGRLVPLFVGNPVRPLFHWNGRCLSGRDTRDRPIWNLLIVARDIPVGFC